jgi:hypothetical protein
MRSLPGRVNKGLIEHPWIFVRYLNMAQNKTLLKIKQGFVKYAVQHTQINNEIIVNKSKNKHLE